MNTIATYLKRGALVNIKSPLLIQQQTFTVIKRWLLYQRFSGYGKGVEPFIRVTGELFIITEVLWLAWHDASMPEETQTPVACITRSLYLHKQDIAELGSSALPKPCLVELV